MQNVRFTPRCRIFPTCSPDTGLSAEAANFGIKKPLDIESRSRFIFQSMPSPSVFSIPETERQVGAKLSMIWSPDAGRTARHSYPKVESAIENRDPVGVPE